MIKLTNENVTLREFTPEDKYRLAELANNPKIAVSFAFTQEFLSITRPQ